MGSLTLHLLWWLAAMLLLGLEVVFSGYFLLWIALAAAATGLLGWLCPGLAWGGQVVAFVALAFASCWGYARGRRRRRRRRRGGDAARLLNRRGEQLLGQRYPLQEAIVQGRGRIQVADGTWSVQGPELPAGAWVEVVAVRGIVLDVIAVPGQAGMAGG